MQGMTRQTVTLHPGKEGNGTDVYNNTCSTEKISGEEKRIHRSLQRELWGIKQNSLVASSLQVNGDSSHCRELYCAGGGT